MPLAEEIINNSYSFQSYEPDQVTINEQVYRQSLILSPDKIIHPWPVTHLQQLTTEHLVDIPGLNPDVILLGTGSRQIFPPMEILGYFANQNLSLEVMDTGALCRTFNILVAEGRSVVAAVIMQQ